MPNVCQLLTHSLEENYTFPLAESDLLPQIEQHIPQYLIYQLLLYSCCYTICPSTHGYLLLLNNMSIYTWYLLLLYNMSIYKWYLLLYNMSIYTWYLLLLWYLLLYNMSIYTWYLLLLYNISIYTCICCYTICPSTYGSCCCYTICPSTHGICCCYTICPSTHIFFVITIYQLLLTTRSISTVSL